MNVNRAPVGSRSIWPLLVPPFFAVYLGVTFAAGRLGIEHLALAVGCLLLVFWNPASRRAFAEALPFLAFLVGYDLFRYPRAALVSSGRVVGCELRDVELSLFPAGANLTWPGYFELHHAPWFDVIAAVPYFAFVYVVVGYGLFLWFKDRQRMRRFLWAFTLGNYFAFVFWLVVPAAPPWYIHQHGCEIQAAALPSAAALARVDDMLGITYFRSLYSQASAVFGAMPSLHCAYPVMGLLVAWKHAGWRSRTVHILYSAWMAISAVYLNHHWILDVFAGWFVAGASVWCAGKLLGWFSVQRHPAAALTSSSEATA